MDTKKEEARLRKQRQRERDKQRDPMEENVTLEDVTPAKMSQPDVTHLPPEWAHVKEFISRGHRTGDMPNLEKLQRIAGSLGKYGDGVYFGDLTMAEIGEVIGILPPLVTTKRI